VIAAATRYAKKGHLARAVLEARPFQSEEVVESDGKGSAYFAGFDAGLDGGWWLMSCEAISGDIITTGEVVRRVIQEPPRWGAPIGGAGGWTVPGAGELRCNWAMDRKWEAEAGRGTSERCTGMEVEKR